jgi:hypothetical protein
MARGKNAFRRSFFETGLKGHSLSSRILINILKSSALNALVFDAPLFRDRDKKLPGSFFAISGFGHFPYSALYI